jgi:aspartyl protease family protein
MVKTANGAMRVAPVELDMVEIDDLEVHNVAAVVLPPDVLNESLLGLSFLSRLRRFEYADGKLVLEQ